MSPAIEHAVIETRFGPLAVEASEHGLLSARFAAASAGEPPSRKRGGGPVLLQAREALAQYDASGMLYDVPLDVRGTTFQRAVWAALAEVAPGSTCAYSDLARRLGMPRAVRAVATAIARNPLALFVPCHRVVGIDGALTGYAWGLERKAALLAWEASMHGACAAAA